MLNSIRGMLAAAIVLGCAASLARADDKDDIKDSIKKLATALKEGDSSTAKKYVDDTENSQKMVESLAKLAHAAQGLQDAAVAKFGEDGKTLGAGRMAGGAPHFDKDLDDAQISVNGDAATVQPKAGTNTAPSAPGAPPAPPARPTAFKKVNGTWKLDMQAMPNAAQMAQSSPMFDKMSDAMTQTAGEIKDGKYASVQEARQALYQKVAAAFGAGGRGAPGGPPR
jgi:hypothetical protein